VAVDGEFVVTFAQAMLKLRNAKDAGTGVSLTRGEVAALVTALRSMATETRKDLEDK